MISKIITRNSLNNLIKINKRNLINFKTISTQINNFKYSKIVESNLKQYKLFNITQVRYFSALPSHVVVGMPALSPTMQTGSIANWLLKEGDSFQPGTAICEVETDKAVVTYEATDEGVLAKILVGKGEIKVGQPIMVTVDNQSDVAAFKSFTLSDSSSTPAPAASAPSNAAPTSAPTQATPPPAVSSPAPISSSTLANGRVFASPLARKLARESSLDVSVLPSKGYASGPNGRVIADDVRAALAAGVNSATTVTTTTSASTTQQTQVQTQQQVQTSTPVSTPVQSVGSLQELYSLSKKTVPHYYLTVEINLSNIQSLRKQLAGEDGEGVSVQDFLVKSAAKAMAKVPEVNSAWMDSFVRKYDQVDINFLVGSGDKLSAPVLRDVNRLGLSSISKAVTSFSSTKDSNDSNPPQIGTFAIHNLGLFGVKAAAPIVLPPQACALALGAIVDTVIPHPKPEDGQKWTIAPVMHVTLSCDHRVVDGAVGAAWLAAFKEYAQNPLTLLL